MNLPNRLTLLRILLIPVLVIIFFIPALREITIYENLNLCYLLSGLIFVVASITDFLDGNIARKRNLVTTFGKFADPLADKILVISSLLLLMNDGLIHAWIIIVILAREFIVSGVRMVAVERGTVIAASKLGKYKTVISMITIIFMFFNPLKSIVIVGDILAYLMVLATVISGFDYFWKNRQVIFESI